MYLCAYAAGQYQQPEQYIWVHIFGVCRCCCCCCCFSSLYFFTISLYYVVHSPHAHNTIVQMCAYAHTHTHAQRRTHTQTNIKYNRRLQPFKKSNTNKHIKQYYIGKRERQRNVMNAQYIYEEYNIHSYNTDTNTCRKVHIHGVEKKIVSTLNWIGLDCLTQKKKKTAHTIQYPPLI